MEPQLSGQLGALSLFDVAQMLLLNGASGTLQVSSERRRGLLRFELGRIVDAADEYLNSGESAAHRILGWRSGSFTFHAGSPGGRRTIRDGSIRLLMDAAKRFDESQPSTPPESRAS